jgi:hypothetical protein
MQNAAHVSLTGWESFYVIVGSSAAALTGLQFVVIVLIAELRRRSPSAQIAAFGTPTVVHFCAALLVAAIMSAPWPTLGSLRVALALTGLAGVGYAVLIAARAHRQTGYKLVVEDWIWHTMLPVAAYIGIGVGAAIIGRDVTNALFLVGAMTLLLLFIGIHNAWDTVIYVAAGHLDEVAEEPEQS